MEALQYGLYADSRIPEDAPVLMAVRGEEDNKIILDGIRQWRRDRREIDRMFLLCDKLAKVQRSNGQRLAEILEKTAPMNNNAVSTPNCNSDA